MAKHPYFDICFFILQIVVFCETSMDSRDDPILEYLGMESDSILEHELVKIDLSGRLHKRDLDAGPPMSFRAFGNDFDLWLRPTEPTFVSDETPVYFANYMPENRIPIEYAPVKDAMKNVGRILQDPKHLASFVLGSNNSEKKMIGYLQSPRDNASLLISSLPTNVVERHLRRRISIDDFNDDFTNSTYHVVVKLKNHDRSG